MDKNGQLTEGSPCCRCGTTSNTTVGSDGHAYCARHSAPQKPTPVDRGIDKAAELMTPQASDV